MARTDRGHRARGANKKNLQNHGATDDEEKKHSVDSGEEDDVDEEKHSTGPGEEKNDVKEGARLGSPQLLGR